MTQEKYLALKDFQSLWTNTLKPYIINCFDISREQSDGLYGSFSMLMPFLSDSTYVTKSIISNPEFITVILDSQDKIVAGVRRDMTYVGLDIPEAIEAIVDVIANINNNV